MDIDQIAIYCSVKISEALFITEHKLYKLYLLFKEVGSYFFMSELCKFYESCYADHFLDPKGLGSVSLGLGLLKGVKY